MITTTRRCLAIGVMWLGFVALTAMPASAQAAPAEVDRLYGGLRAAPTINAPVPVVVLSETGERTVAPASAAIPTRVLASQSTAQVAATSRASVQGLAFTGADVVTMVTVGLVAIVLGLVLNRRSRPRSLGDS